MIQPGISRAEILSVIACLILLLLCSCESGAENSPSEVVETFLEKVQFLSEPIYEKEEKKEIDPGQAAEYNEVRKELPRLFESEQRGRIIMMGFLFGKFDSYRISEVDVQGDTAEVEVEIVGSKFLGIPSEGLEASPHRIRFRLVKKNRRWYISELLTETGAKHTP